MIPSLYATTAARGGTTILRYLEGSDYFSMLRYLLYGRGYRLKRLHGERADSCVARTADYEVAIAIFPKLSQTGSMRRAAWDKETAAGKLAL